MHQDRNPSFSSTLLDEIYRSIDECEAGQESGGRRQSHCGGGSGSIFIHQQHYCSPINLRRAHSIGRRAATVDRDGQRYAYGALDPLFSSPGGGGSHTTWCRAGGGGFSSSETEKKYTTSLADAPTLPRLRPVRTNVVSKAHPAVRTKAAAAATAEKKSTNSKRSQLKKQDQESNSDNDRGDGGFITKPRSRALKIYDHLVLEKAKLQSPPSPGGRLSAFLASLFAARGRKKTKRPSSSSSDSSLAAGDATSSNCSSASSYTRSCLSKTSPSSRQQLNGKKSVTFYPSDSVATPGTTGGTMKARECSPTSEGESVKNCFHQNQKKGQFMGFKFMDNVNDDDDDAESCASSDLFELDHLEPIGVGRRYEGLRPVYETTRVDRPNRAAQFVI